MASKMDITGTADTALANPHYANFERPPSISESWKVDNQAGHLRIDGRLPSQLRLTKITTGYLMTAAGSAFCYRPELDTGFAAHRLLTIIHIVPRALQWITSTALSICPWALRYELAQTGNDGGVYRIAAYA